MGMGKKELEKKEENDKHSGIFCSMCGEEIPFNDLENAEQGNGVYLCSTCRYKQEKMEEE